MKIKNTIPALFGALTLLAQVSFGQVINGNFSNAGPSLPTTEVADSWFINSNDYVVATSAGMGRVVYVTGSFLGMNNGSPFIGVDGVDTNPNGSGGPAVEVFRQTGMSVRSTATTLTYEAASRFSDSVRIEIWLNNTMLGSQWIESNIFNSFSMPVSGQNAGPNNVLSIRQASFNHAGGGVNDFGIDNIQIPCGDCEAEANIEIGSDCNPIEFYANGPSTSYLWDFGDGTTSSFANPVHQYANEGTYTVTLVSYISDGCGTCCDVSSITIDVNCGEFTGEPMTWGNVGREGKIKSNETGLNSMNHTLNNEIAVYPNPTTDQTNISFALDKAETVNLQLYTNTGKLVSTLINKRAAEKGEVKMSIETESLPAGIYHVVLSTDSDRKTTSFVVSK